MLATKDLERIGRLVPHRKMSLFNEFLPQGYELTTINTVSSLSEVMKAKVLLGTIITLYDDLADRPDLLNRDLLSLMYQIPFGPIDHEPNRLNRVDKDLYLLAKSLFFQLKEILINLPQYGRLKDLFEFDLKQFFLANQYAEIVTEVPAIFNTLENKLYMHHNMGIVMAGMIDLMSLGQLFIEELGKAREVFLLGQRAARISNIVTTYEREAIEKDRTNELDLSLPDNIILFNKERLEREQRQILKKMDQIVKIRLFSIHYYLDGIKKLHHLHLIMKEEI